MSKTHPTNMFSHWRLYRRILIPFSLVIFIVAGDALLSLMEKGHLDFLLPPLALLHHRPLFSLLFFVLEPLLSNSSPVKLFLLPSYGPFSDLEFTQAPPFS